MREKIYNFVKAVLVVTATIVLTPIYGITMVILTLALPMSYILTNPKNDYKFDKGSLTITTIIVLALLALFSPVAFFYYRDANYTIAQESLPDFIALKEKLAYLYSIIWSYVLAYCVAMFIMLEYNIKVPKFLYLNWLFINEPEE